MKYAESVTKRNYCIHINIGKMKTLFCNYGKNETDFDPKYQQLQQCSKNLVKND